MLIHQWNDHTVINKCKNNEDKMFDKDKLGCLATFRNTKKLIKS